MDSPGFVEDVVSDFGVVYFFEEDVGADAFVVGACADWF